MRTITALAAAALTGAAGLAITAAAVLPAGADTPSDDDGTTSFLEDRLSRIREALEGLVGDGTLTPEEADAVAETLNDSDLFRPHRPGGHMDGLGLDVAAETLGLTEDELLTQLRDGATLAEIAADQGVDTQTLVDALVAAASERIDEAVADGRLDQDRADEMKATSSRGSPRRWRRASPCATAATAATPTAVAGCRTCGAGCRTCAAGCPDGAARTTARTRTHPPGRRRSSPRPWRVERVPLALG